MKHWPLSMKLSTRDYGYYMFIAIVIGWAFPYLAPSHSSPCMTVQVVESHRYFRNGRNCIGSYVLNMTT